MPTLIERLRRRYETRPDSVFCHLLKDGAEQAITVGALVEGAARYAASYRAAGVDTGDVVFVVLRHSADLLQAFVGGLMAGCVPAYLAPPSPKQDPWRYWQAMGQMLVGIAPRAMIVEGAERQEILARLPDAPCAVLTPADAAAAAAVAWPSPAADDLAFLQFSSGTTGQRKGVMLSHRAVEAQLAAYAPSVGLDAEAVVASWLPLYHDMGLIAGFMAPLALGPRLVLLDPFEWVAEPASLLRAIERHRATHVWLPNFAFNHLAGAVPAQARFDLGSVRAFVNCSEPCKAASFDRFLERFASCGVRAETLQCCYAMAEAVFAVTQTDAGTPVRRRTCESSGLPLLSVGRPLPGVSIEIRDEAGRAVANGQIGEIAIRGSSVFDGYYRAPAESAAAIAGGWYLTGDLGLLHDGELFITGRRKDVIICYGRNYYAHDVEAIATEVPGVKPGRAVAFGLANPHSGSEDLIVVAERSVAEGVDDKATARAIKAAVLRALNVTVAKVRLVPAGWLVKTTSGKLGRGENKTKYLATIAPGDDRQTGAA